MVCAWILPVSGRGSPKGRRPEPSASSYTTVGPGPPRLKTSRRKSDESAAQKYPNSDGLVRVCLAPDATEIATIDFFPGGPSEAMSHCPSADQERFVEAA